jgi:hypothetical protein
MPANSFTNAAAAARTCDRNRAIAACSVPMGRCPVRQFKPSVRVRGTELTAVRGEGIKWRTIASERHVTGWLIPAPVRWRGGFLRFAIIGGLFVPVAVRAVIWIIALIWMGTACIVNATPLQSHPLPLHGAVLSRHDCAGSCARFRRGHRGLLRLAGIGLCHSARKQTHLVGHRADLGQIFVKRRYEDLA